MIKPAGIPPMNGPKKGIMFVTPTTTLISSGYGILRRLNPMKHNTAIIAESRSLPDMKPRNILLEN